MTIALQVNVQWDVVIAVHMGAKDTESNLVFYDCIQRCVLISVVFSIKF